MRILGIETSCDETSAAVVEDGWLVRSCTIASSRKDFERMGGVVPEDAARKQAESIIPTISDALACASVTLSEIDAIAVTIGPGLLGSLLVGTTSAHVLASVGKKPLIAVHHTHGHLCSVGITEDASAKPELRFPILTLSVSGGHTDLWLRTDHIQGILLGTTRDDAAGEAFDKGAVLFGLPYPGGPALEKLAEGGREDAFEFPNPLSDTRAPEFSFSGLKTSLKYRMRDTESMSPVVKRNLAASYQAALIRHMTSRLSTALDMHPSVREVHLVGGVSANSALRGATSTLVHERGLTLRYPCSLRFCTDNAAMIASAGFYLHGECANARTRSVANATLSLAEGMPS